MPKVLVLPFMLNGAPGPYLDALQAVGLEPVYPPKGRFLGTPEELLAHLDGCEAALAGMEPFNRDVLAASKLRVIGRMGVGYDAIDIPAATERGIAVTITPGANEVSVAEQTLALMLGVMRGFPERDREVRCGKWKREKLPRLAGKTLGLLGMGRIGKAVVPRAQGLGLNVIAYDPCPDQTFAAAMNVRMVELDELFATSDIVSLHSPCTPETTNIINARTLAQMKRGSVLVNTARGGLVDEEALYAALRERHLLGAGLDVFKTEPLPLDSPLLQLDNALLCCHMGGLDEESEVAMSRMAAECIARLFRGDWPEGCVVNASIRDGWKW